MHAAPIGLVSVVRCAELLTAAGDKIERSALSRYCDVHGLKGARDGRSVLVDFEAVQAHRAANYQREVMAGGVALPPAPTPVASAAIEAQPAPVAQIPPRDDPQRGLKAVQLRRELREEAQEEGRLTETAEVDAGAAEAIVEMRSSFAAVRADLAERMAAELGVPPEKVRTLRAWLKRYDRVGQERFAARMARALSEGNESQGEARDRLMTLAGHAIRLRGASTGSLRRTA